MRPTNARFALIQPQRTDEGEVQRARVVLTSRILYARVLRKVNKINRHAIIRVDLLNLGQMLVPKSPYDLAVIAPDSMQCWSSLPRVTHSRARHSSPVHAIGVDSREVPAAEAKVKRAAPPRIEGVADAWSIDNQELRHHGAHEGLG